MFSSRLALAAALALVAAAAPAAAKKPDAAPASTDGAADPNKITKTVRPIIGEAQKQLAAGDGPGALAQLRTAEAQGNLSSTDVYFIGRIKLNIGITLKDNAVIEEALKALVASEFVSASDKSKYNRNLANFALQRNDYAAATTYYEQFAATPGVSADDLGNLAELYARQKQYPQAVATLRRAIDAAKATGKPADENLYRRELKIAFDNKMPAAVQAASVDLVTAYPTPVNWRDALLLFRDGQKLDDQGLLDVFRLMDAAGALNGERDYAEYVETAISKGLPGEAKAVLAEGVQKGMVSSSKPYIAEYNKSIATRLAADKAGMAAADREARGGANGKTAVGQGDAYYGYGEYAKSAEMYRLALTKGGVDAATVNLRLGAALARSGDKAGAATAFAAVSGGPRATLAQYWTLWLSQKA